MPKDYANINKLLPKLNKIEQEKYENDPFCDAFDSTKNFAEELESDIATKETPYVLLLEGGYGTGKTFFSSRFSRFLDERYETIYFSAWENDYLPDPFLAFSKVIIQHFPSTNPTGKRMLSHPVAKIFKSLLGSTTIGVSAGLKGTFNMGTFFNNLEKEFSNGNDPVEEFKKRFQKIITHLNGQKLVIIVDELDRCRPDYAMKVLEITKHFFDIEGIFVIVPTNKIALKRSLQALYGIDPKEEEQNPDIECYYTKFFDAQRTIPPPNYENTIASLMPQTSLQQAFDKGLLVKDAAVFNDYSTLIQKMAEYCKQGGFSLRQTTHLCEEMIHLCNNFYEPVRVEYLAYLLCNKLRNEKRGKDDKPLTLGLSAEHPYAEQSGRKQIFDLTRLKDTINSKVKSAVKGYYSYPQLIGDFEAKLTNSIIKPYYTTYKQYYERNDEIEAILSYFETRLDSSTISYKIREIIKETRTTITDQIKTVKAYQTKFEGDDNMASRKQIYQTIVKNPQRVWSYKKTAQTTQQVTT